MIKSLPHLKKEMAKGQQFEYINYDCEWELFIADITKIPPAGIIKRIKDKSLRVKQVKS